MNDPAVLKFREERNRRIQEALSRQPRRSQEEAYAQYDRIMGITPRTITADNDDDQQTDTNTIEKENAGNP